MTRKIYKSAMGKTIDMGALMLQNEQTRSVGNMNVNARGDMLDSQNRVVETRSRQAQRKYQKQSINTSNIPVSNGTIHARNRKKNVDQPEDTFSDMPEEELELDMTPPSPPKATVEPVATTSDTSPRGGLAAAIARSREIKQELEKTQRQRMQEQPVKKI